MGTILVTASMTKSNSSRIKLLISSFPGVHLRQIQRILGLSFSSVRYNVDALEKNGEVLVWSEGGRSHLFAPTITQHERLLYYHLRSRTSSKILRAIAKDGKLTNRQLSEITGFAKSTLSECIRRLLDAKILITAFSSHARVAYQLREPDTLLPILRAHDRTVLDEAAERFTQLWDF
jgi:predicted transcriptional regulator